MNHQPLFGFNKPHPSPLFFPLSQWVLANVSQYPNAYEFYIQSELQFRTLTILSPWDTHEMMSSMPLPASNPATAPPPGASANFQTAQRPCAPPCRWVRPWQTAAPRTSLAQSGGAGDGENSVDRAGWIREYIGRFWSSLFQALSLKLSYEVKLRLQATWSRLNERGQGVPSAELVPGRSETPKALQDIRWRVQKWFQRWQVCALLDDALPGSAALETDVSVLLFHGQHCASPNHWHLQQIDRSKISKRPWSSKFIQIPDRIVDSQNSGDFAKPRHVTGRVSGLAWLSVANLHSNPGADRPPRSWPNRRWWRSLQNFLPCFHMVSTLW